MKNILMACALVLLSGMYLHGQSKYSGVYLTERDFENNKLSYATNNKSDQTSIRFNDFFEKPFITIKHNGEKILLFKDEIFACKNKGSVVRTCNFVSYTFSEKGPIWIYYKDQNVSHGKGIQRQRNYYYSPSGKEPIVPLTVDNLKRSFPEKHMFHVMLDAQFRKDADLASYDGLEKKFKVNHILETTLFQTAKR